MAEDDAPAEPWTRPEGLWIAIIDAIADPLFVKDEQHRWIAVNRSFCEFMGHPREALLGKSDFEFVPEAEARVFWAKDEEVFRTGKVVINEETLTDSTGKTHIIVTKKAPFTDSRGRTILVGIITDVTEERRMQAELRRARDELEDRIEERTREVAEAHAHLRQAQKMEAVGQLTGGIAHDFNNLLGVVAGNVEMAATLTEKPEVERLLGRAMTATERGSVLIQRLLAFSRHQAPGTKVADVGRLVLGMLDLLRRSIGASIEIETNIAPKPCWCRVDPSQLETAVLNLCINARDAMPEGGRLRIGVHATELDAPHAERVGLEPGHWVRIEVADSGSGMDAETARRAFEPFFTTKAPGKGSGLGLSMVYAFSRQHGGTIRVDSVRNVGSRFEMLLPVSDPRARNTTVPPPTTGDLPMGGGASVLLVEDDDAVRDMTRELLRGLGYRVTVAASSDEAVEQAAKSTDIDILLTDVMLAGSGSGQDVAEHIRATHPEARIVFMSGYTDNILDPEWLGDGVELLSKPFRRRELAEALHRARQRLA